MSDKDRLKLIIPNAVETTPVRGKILVDGAPVKDLWVTLHPVGGTKETLRPKAQTDAKGNFAITSYIGGDGAPAGSYKVTVEWLTFQQFGSSWGGPTKLEDSFAKPETTPFSVTVEESPVDLPTYEVTAKSPADVKKSAPTSRADMKRK